MIIKCNSHQFKIFNLQNPIIIFAKQIVFQVISGLDVSVALLNVGEKCLLKIEPRLAFGTKGLPPKIPPNVVVIYEVELVSVEPEDEIENLTIQQRKITG